jgi:hypothetical protein
MRARIGLLTLGLFFVGSSAHADTPMHLWSKHFGSGSEDVGERIAFGPTGNVAMTGWISGPADFGGGFRFPIFSDMFVAAYDASGVHQFSKLFNEAVAQNLTFDPLGNVIMVGYYFQGADFGGGVLPGDLGGGFIVKLDSNGAHVWSKGFPGAYPECAATRASGNVVVTGGFGGTVSFGGPPLTAMSGDVFVVEYDPSGAHIWSKRYGGASGENGKRIALDGSGSIVLSGRCSGPVDFGGGTLTGPEGFFLMKLNDAGIHQWSQRFGGANNDDAEGLVVDDDDNILLAGWYSGTVNFGGQPLTPVGGNDVFLAKYAPDGTHVWSQSRGGPGDLDRAFGLTVDGTGSATIVGEFKPGADFGGGTLPNAGGIDIFIARYDPNGFHVWSAGFGTLEFEEAGRGVVAGADGNVTFVGLYARTIDFGGGPLPSNGWHDIFLAKFGNFTVPVLITNFEATVRGNTVDITWDVSADETLERFTLYRRNRGDSEVSLATGHPVTTRSYTDVSVVPGETYEYELMIETETGEVYRSPISTVTVDAAINALDQNQPNPFNPSTTISYTLGERTSVAVGIYDSAGLLVVRLEQGEREAGRHRLDWDGRDSAGRSVASGVYFYQLEGVSGVAARKMLLLK